MAVRGVPTAAWPQERREDLAGPEGSARGVQERGSVAEQSVLSKAGKRGGAAVIAQDHAGRCSLNHGRGGSQ